MSELQTRDFFVVTETASLCPTVAQAIENECGSSVESVDKGSIRRRGQRVTVVGSEPVEGVWRAIRNTKLGDLPAWVEGDRLAPDPDVSHVEAFRKAHEDALVLQGGQLRVVTGRGPSGSLALYPFVLYAETDHGRLFFEVPRCFAASEAPDERYEYFHRCLLYTDCGELDYVCDEGEYCDEIAIVTGSAQPLEREGPRNFTGYPIRKLEQQSVWTPSAGADLASTLAASNLVDDAFCIASLGSPCQRRAKCGPARSAKLIAALADRFGVFAGCDVDEARP